MRKCPTNKNGALELAEAADQVANLCRFDTKFLDFQPDKLQILIAKGDEAFWSDHLFGAQR